MDLLLYQLTFSLIKLLFLFPCFLLVYFRAFTPGTEGQQVLLVDYSWHRAAATQVLDTGIFAEKEHTKTSAAQDDFLLMGLKGKNNFPLPGPLLHLAPISAPKRVRFCSRLNASVHNAGKCSVSTL